MQIHFREQTAEQITGRFRGRIDFDFVELRDFAAVRHDYAVNGTGGGNRNVIDDAVNGIAQEFETGNEGDIEIAAGQLRAKRGRVIEYHLAGPATNERARVEILNATDSERIFKRRQVPLRHALA